VARQLSPGEGQVQVVGIGDDDGPPRKRDPGIARNGLTVDNPQHTPPVRRGAKSSCSRATRWAGLARHLAHDDWGPVASRVAHHSQYARR
jgi:hypothetical protein